MAPSIAVSASVCCSPEQPAKTPPETTDREPAEPETPPWGGTRYRYKNAGELFDVMAAAVPRFAALGVHAWEIWNEAGTVTVTAW